MGEADELRRIEPAWCEDFITRWIDAWNAHDCGRVLELLTDDVICDDTASPRTVHGKAEMSDLVARNWRAFPDLAFTVVGAPFVGIDGPRAAYYWRSSGTHRGPIDPPGFPATGKRVELDGVDLHEYRDGKIAKLRIISDMNELAVQLGMLPRPGSRTEKATVALQKLRSRFADHIRP